MSHKETGVVRHSYNLPLSREEKARITEDAQRCGLTTTEYLRRIALHRRADVKVENEMIFELIQCVKEVRLLREELVRSALPPPDGYLEALIIACEEAVHSLSRYGQSPTYSRFNPIVAPVQEGPGFQP